MVQRRSGRTRARSRRRSHATTIGPSATAGATTIGTATGGMATMIGATMGANTTGGTTTVASGATTGIAIGIVIGTGTAIGTGIGGASATGTATGIGGIGTATGGAATTIRSVAGTAVVTMRMRTMRTNSDASVAATSGRRKRTVTILAGSAVRSKARRKRIGRSSRVATRGSRERRRQRRRRRRRRTQRKWRSEGASSTRRRRRDEVEWRAERGQGAAVVWPLTRSAYQDDNRHDEGGLPHARMNACSSCKEPRAGERQRLPAASPQPLSPWCSAISSQGRIFGCAEAAQ
mmetsp:Transcript_20529/g.41734  ORF Transcript_20529/g.41734 Transcript_20529/m.41734 type:complete len:291 (+) Transcript_20529:619-1491(+)